MNPENSAQHVWEAALGRLQVQVPRPSFDTWLKGTAAVSLVQDRLTIAVASAFAAESIQLRLHGLILEAVAAVAHTRLGVSYQVAAGTSLPSAPWPAAAPRPPATDPHAAQAPLPLPQLYERYTFDAFMVGSSNRLAHAAALAVADAPGRAYNPLFLYGGVGLGKTHLLQAIAHRAQQAGRRPRYVTSEAFTNEFLTAIRDRRTADFRDKYRAADLLLVDDIQFLSGKEGTQEGFFHTFNALHQAGRQIVLAADRPPSAITLLEERLRSRFESGLLADISPPDLETRMAILRDRAALSPIPIPTAVTDALAAAAPPNVRVMEGTLNRIIAHAQFTGCALTPELALRQLLPASMAAQPAPDTVLDAVCTHFAITRIALTSSTRTRALAAARTVAIAILHEDLHVPSAVIGSLLGNRDRTTILAVLRQRPALPTSPHSSAIALARRGLGLIDRTAWD